MSNPAIEKLETVDWDFPRVTTPQLGIHGFVRFPGNFIPDIPAYLIEALSNPGDLVMDPFCGSGTTGIEAVRLSRRAVISDSNRVAVEIASAKACVLQLQGNIAELEQLETRLTPLFRVSRISNSHRPDELYRWFHPETLLLLDWIWTEIDRGELAYRPLLRILFYETLFDCAAPLISKTATGKRRRHHWGWIADNVRPKHLAMCDPIVIYRQRLLNAIRMAASLRFPSTISLSVQMENAQCLSLADKTVRLVVTSPPYLGMIDYTLANRLVYLWHGWNMGDDLAMEIGARRHRNRGTVVEDYLKAMNLCFSEIHRTLSDEGHLALVIGSSRMFGRMVECVEERCLAQFSRVWGPKPRSATRRRVADRLGREPEEFVIVYKK